jgi:hypothetical protein
MLTQGMAWAAAHDAGDRPQIAIAHLYLGSALNEQGRFAEALPECIAAQAPFATIFGASSDMVGATLKCQGDALIGLGKPAVEVLEHALALIDDGSSDPGEVADARFSLARALTAAHREPARAKALAIAARDELRGAGDAVAPTLAAVEAWLRRQP